VTAELIFLVSCLSGRLHVFILHTQKWASQITSCVSTVWQSWLMP